MPRKDKKGKQIPQGDKRKRTDSKITRGITESQFDEVLKRVIRKPSEKPSDSKESET